MLVGNNKGFKISLDTTKNIFRVKAWGFWDIELAQKYESAFTEKIEELRSDEKEWCILVDLTDFYPRSPEVQNLLKAQISQQEVKKAAYLGKKSDVQLRLNKFFRENDMQRHAFFEFSEQALQWLLDGE